jgi:HEAT repeat protein
MQSHLPIKSLLMIACLAAAAPSATAQLDLPDRPKKRPAPSSKSVDLPEEPRGNLAERVIGSNPNQEPERGSKSSGELDLPSAASSKRRPAAPRSESGPAPAPLEAPPASLAQPSDAAQFIMAELRRAREVDARFTEQAVRSLLDLGEPGLRAARAALNADHAPLVLVSARVLLNSPAAPDRKLVSERLRTRLPNAACSPLVDAFVRLDPVAASPSVLCELLDHKQRGVRTAAQRSLNGRSTPDMVEPLRSALESKRTDTRLRALELLRAIDDASVRGILLDRLKDPAARVAMRAASGLSLLEGEDVVAALLRRAFGGPWILRDGAYALLALIEREDTQLAPVLDERHVESLLVGLTSSDPFVSGVCASALAGVGFRSASLVDAEWLDRDVPHELVRGISGIAFHSDFTSLLPAATRRLDLISGKSFGNDGPSWLGWWSEEGEGFKARRAHLFATPEDATSLVVDFVSTEEIGIADRFRLLGPAAQAENAARGASEELRLSGLQARDFFALLGREGALTAERMPGVRGISGSAGRELSITVAGRAKTFRFTQGASEPWFEKLVATAASLRERNRWQRYHDPLQYTTAQEMWVAESAWWDEDHGELERDLRLKRMVFDVLPLREVDQRDEGLRELRRIYQDPATVQPDDFPKLVTLLGDEAFIGPRARVFLDLLLHHIEPTEAVNTHAQILATAMLDTFGSHAAPELAEVFARAGRAFVRAAALDPRPDMRSLACAQLVRNPEPRDTELLLELLADRLQEVELAAIDAVGQGRLEAARTELLVRARLAEPVLRRAALRAIGTMGGEGVLDALVVSLSDKHPDVVRGAAEGLAELGDPETAPLLVSLLSRGRASEIFEPARQGLLRLGAAAWPDLLRAVNTPGHRAGREAALVLSLQGVVESVPALMSMLTQNPADAFIARELAVLTCIDMRKQGDPQKAWWDWWEDVVHGDSLVWLCAALERRGVRAPPPADVRAGTRAGTLFLLDVVAREDAVDAHVVERARRELARLLDADPGGAPRDHDQRVFWIAGIRGQLEPTWE